MKKILGVGSIQRKEERKRRKDKEILNFKNEEPTHCINEIRNDNIENAIINSELKPRIVNNKGIYMDICKGDE